MLHQNPLRNSRRWILLALQSFAFGLLLGDALRAFPSQQIGQDPHAGPDEAIPAWNVPAAPALPGFRWEDALGGLTFEDPVVVVTPAGETNRLFVVERTGMVQVVTNLAAPIKTPFLDLRTNLAADYLEAGVLGMAFHPGYATNRQFYVFRTVREQSAAGTTRLLDVLARFTTLPDNPNLADPASETRLIVQQDLSDTHNAGDLQFGPDGYLYVTLGDARPPSAEEDGSKQPLLSFFGGILRIDVDRRPGNLRPNPRLEGTGEYAIPNDNPFIGLTSYGGKPVDPGRIRTEFYAIGFRNPWRIAFDETSGRLIAGEVGESDWEELDLVEPGANYGWPYREGNTNGIYWFLEPPGMTLESPLVAYAHGSATNQGNAVVAGVWYHGAHLPGLGGTHIYADCRSGHTWALRLPEDGAPPQVQWLCTEPGLVTFALDPRDGEVLAANYRAGRIRKLTLIPENESPEIPGTLRETGVFTDPATLQTRPNLVPYEINAPFWSDHAIKRRWIALPAGQTPHLTSDGSLVFPTGTVWVKHFDLELTNGVPESRRRLETRLLVRSSAGVYGVTYRWGDSLTNALLVPAEGLDEPFVIHDGNAVRTQVWHYPGRGECLRCHNPHAGFALGYTPAQLNRQLNTPEGPVSQLEHLRGLGAVPSNLPPAEDIPALADPSGATAPLEERVRAYLASNCSGCHRPDSLIDTGASWDARLETPLASMGLLDGRLVIPGKPDGSRLIHVVARTAVDLVMPPLATNVRDDAAVNLLTQWINTLPRSPWVRADIGPARIPGYSLNGEFAAIGSSGAGLDAPEPGYHFLSRTLAGDGLVEVRIRALDSATSTALAGLLLVDSTNSDAQTRVALAVDPEHRLHYSSGPDLHSIGPPAGNVADFPIVLRLTRTGPTVTWEAGQNLTDSTLRTTSSVPAEEELKVGVFASSGQPPSVARASLDTLKFARMDWTSPPPDAAFALGASIPLAVDLETDGTQVNRVEFQADGQLIGTASGAPFRVTWTNANSGDHTFTARWVGTEGVTLISRPRTVTVQAGTAAFIGVDRTTTGDWKGHYGNYGYQLWGLATLLPETVSMETPGVDVTLLDPDSADPRALVRPDGTGRVSAVATAPDVLDIRISLSSQDSERLAVYCVDWSGTDQRAQEFKLLDPITGDVLDRQIVSAFSGGVYLQWRVSGMVWIRVQSLDEHPPSMSGLFLDRRQAAFGSVHLVSPTDGMRLVAPGSLTMQAEPDAGTVAPSRVSFLVDGIPVAESTRSDLTGSWTHLTAGAHVVVARGFDNLGDPVDSMPVHIVVERPPASALFVGTDETIGGDWPYRLGSSASLVAPNHQNSTVDALIAVSTGAPYQWETWNPSTPTQDRRAPVALEYGVRDAACWTSPNAVMVDVDLLDGRPSLLALYLVDWDTNLREEHIEIVESGTDRTLAAHDIREFYRGIHVFFLVRGAVQVRVWSGPVNAVLSGIFLDPVEEATSLTAMFTSLALRPDGVQLEWLSGAGTIYRVLGTDDPGTGWSAFPLVLTSADGKFQFFDSRSDETAWHGRFYQLQLLSSGDGPLRLPPPQ